MTARGTDAELRAELRLTSGITVLTGGQTGVDTLAARAALAAGLPVHVVFPRGFRQEDGPLTPERRAGLRGAVLHELASTGFAPRTRACVRLADAVLLFDPAGGAGCEETVRVAGLLGRPLLDLTGSGAAGPAVLSFIRDNRAQVLMFAGCRGSQLAGQIDVVRAQVEQVAAALRECGE
ncbi:MAG TPA: putative molybdenum carrier protein [Streptosporangiaceae bacterium]|nr:putative molybdenum carrier protein [Streptosporangiaceae bacterium]